MYGQPNEVVYQTSQLAPATVTLATLDPAGWGLPPRSIQIISSAPLGWPVVVGVLLNQMS